MRKGSDSLFSDVDPEGVQFQLTTRRNTPIRLVQYRFASLELADRSELGISRKKAKKRSRHETEEQIKKL